MIFEKKVEAIYRSKLYRRCDDLGNVFYFSVADFPGLLREPYPFRASAGHTLQGYFYHYGSPVPGRVVVFDHGMGGGHRSYLKEIEQLARAGYRVFAYDHTGCMESGGESTNGFAQSLNDLNAVLNTLKADPALAGTEFSVIGHSWGGYACLNIGALHPDLRHIIAISGYASVRRILQQNFSGLTKPYFRAALRWETEANPDYVELDAAESLKKTTAKVLILHSEDDRDVSFDLHFRYLQSALSGIDHIRFIPVQGKGHNPNYTADAVRYKDAFFKELTHSYKKNLLSTPAQKQSFIARFDWNRMTTQDPDIWAAILQRLME